MILLQGTSPCKLCHLLMCVRLLFICGLLYKRHVHNSSAFGEFQVARRLQGFNYVRGTILLVASSIPCPQYLHPSPRHEQDNQLSLLPVQSRPAPYMLRLTNQQAVQVERNQAGNGTKIALVSAALVILTQITEGYIL